MTKRLYTAKYGLPMCLIGLLATPAMAQAPAAPPPDDQAANASSESSRTADEDRGGVGEIVVTAQRRAENVQAVPLSITAVTGDQLRATGATNLVSLGDRLSNVNINIVQNIVRINIRGIGSNAVTPVTEGSVAFHVDGVYITRPEAQSAAFFDVQRIEVLRGPQGILYGRNATGGAVNLITNGPTDHLDGFAQLTIGNYSTVLTEGAIGGPLAEGVSARIAFQTSNHSGYLQQLFGVSGETSRGIDDLKSRAVRGQLRLQPSPALSFTLSGDYFYQNDASGYLIDFGPGDAPGSGNLAITLGGGSATGDVRTQRADYPNSVDKENWGVSLTGVWDIADSAELTSISAYRNYHYLMIQDSDQTNAAGTFVAPFGDAESFSQELRLTGSHGRFRYVFGGYYLSSLLDAGIIGTRNRFYFGGPNLMANGVFNQFQTDTEALAGFGQISYDVTDWLGVDLGVRYSWERQIKRNEMLYNNNTEPLVDLLGPRNFTMTPDARVSFDSWTPKATVRITPIENVMLYASYSAGFRSGGFSLGGAAPFLPEELTSYEVGIRTRFLNNRVQANITAFLYDYTNLQVRRALPAGGSVLESAGSAAARGIEAEIAAIPIDNLRINLNIGLLRTEFEEYSTSDGLRPSLGILDLRGNRFVESPPYRINLGAEYTFRPSWGNVTIRGEARFTGRVYFTVFNTVPYSQPSNDLFDLYVNYTSPDGKWFGGAYIRNIENEDVRTGAFGASLAIGGFVQGLLGPPRTFGISVGRRF